MSELVNQYMADLFEAKQQIKQAIINKGGTIEGGLSSYADAINSIEIGGGDSGDVDLGTVSKNIDKNGAYVYYAADDELDGYSTIVVNVDVPEQHFATQMKSISITKNGSQTVSPDSGYNGLSEVEITVNVAGSGGGDSGKPKISNGFRFTGGDMSLIDWALYDWSNVYNFSHFFTNCTASDPTWTIRFGEHVINKIDHPICFDNMFVGSKFTELDLSSWDTSRVISMSALCFNCKDLTKINITGWDYSGLMSPDDCLVSIGSSPLLDSGTSVMFGESNISEIIGSVFLGKYMSRYIQSTGSGYSSQNWAPKPFTTSNLGYPDLIFDDDLTRLDYYFYLIQSNDLSKLSNINTSNVTTISSIFYQNQSMTSLNDISGWDTHNVKDMSYAFYNCKKLSNIEALNNWNLGKVEDLSYTFGAGYSSSKVPINSINMSIFTNPDGYKMDYTFIYSDIQNIEGVCRPTSLRYTFEQSKITKVTIDLSQCTNITQCFNQCQNLVEVTLIGDPSKLTTISNVFYGAKSGVTLYYDSNYDYSKLSIPSSWTQIPL